MSGGIGISPNLEILRHLARRDPTREVALVHSATTGAEAALWNEAEALVAGMPRAASHLFLSRAEPAEAAKNGALPGRIDLVRLAAHLPLAGARAYICGPPAFVAAAQAQFASGLLTAEAVHAEAFVSPRAGLSVTSPPTASGPFRVTFAKSGVVAEWTPSVGTLLDAAEGQGLRLPANCRSGACERCAQVLRSGEVAYVAEPVIPPPAGKALLCCAVLTSDILIDA